MEGEIETLLREQGENTNSISNASEREDEDADFFQGMRLTSGNLTEVTAPAGSPKRRPNLSSKRG